MGRARDPRSGAGAALTARRTLRPTRAGWVYFAFTSGIGFAALNTGNNLQYLVFSLMLAFLVLSGILSESALRGLQVVRRLPRELYAGADNSVRLEIGNSQRRAAAFAIVVEDRAFAQSRASRDRSSLAVGRVFVLRIGAEETVCARYAFKPERRGTIDFAPIRVSTRFPFGLFVKTRVLDIGGSALAYPEIQDARSVLPPTASAREGESPRPAAGTGSDVAGLREFHSGDPLRRVHWKSSLKRRALLVLQVEDEREAEVEVELDTRPTRNTHPSDDFDGFEWRVSRAATEVLRHLDAGLRVGLRTQNTRLPFGTGAQQRARLLSFLARVDHAA